MQLQYPLEENHWLAQTKLQRPHLREDIVPRHRLLDLLRQSVASHRLTLISAPAGFRMAASLDIYGAAREWNKKAGQPYTWPGDGSVVPVRSHINEWPSPTTHCPGHRGLPVIAFFETSVNVTNHTFTTGDQQPVDHCVFDGTDYKNPDGNARNLGRSILGGANAVVLMPDEPLLPGEQYCFSVTSRGVTTDACFTVDPNA